MMKHARRLLSVGLVCIAIGFSGSAGQDREKTSRTVGLDPAAAKAINEMGGDLAKLNESHQNLMMSVGELQGLYSKLAKKVEEVAKLAADANKAKGKATDQLFKATRQMQEMQMSFSLQYLQLQNEISKENRQFSMVSNIMKNKHDTAKNSINNIR